MFLLLQEKPGEAENELREAIRLDPDDPETMSRLGEVHAQQGRLGDAIAAWLEAGRLEPTSAEVHAQLGRVYAQRGERTKAIAELKLAERLDPDNVNAEQMICQAYDTLHDTPAALAHYERFITLARKLGGNPELVAAIERRARVLKATLSATFIIAKRPKAYTETSLDAVLRERLSNVEVRLVTRPLASTPEMKRWAEQLTEGATEAYDKAKRIFDGLARRIEPGGGGSRTAQEAFTVWNDPRVALRCQEYARLYVALARSVGLDAYFVFVEKIFNGAAVPHACAGVFVDGKALLVDPSYRWFGVPHEQFEVLDDLKATGLHLTQLDDLPSCRVAAKLLPDFQPALFNLALSLMNAGRLNDADAALKDALRVEPDSWLARYAQAVRAGYANQWNQAVSLVQKSLELNPAWDKPYFLLAQALRQQGKLSEAREAYRDYLRHQLDPDFVEDSRRAIADINEKLGGE